MQGPADIWKPALIAGTVFGFLSGVPIVGALNIACCSLIVGAGVLASFMMVRGSEQALTYGRAALGGMIAGAVASPVQSATSLLFTAMVLRRDPQQELQQALDSLSNYLPDAGETMKVLNSVPLILWMTASMVLFVFVFAVFGMLGGVIGRAMFERRVAPTTPPAGSDSGGHAADGPIQP